MTPREVPDLLYWLAAVPFAFGGFLCLANFWLLVGAWRYSRQPEPKPVRPYVSPVPIIGSVMVFAAMRAFEDFVWVQWLAYILIAVDTGGLHWALGGLIAMALRAVWLRLSVLIGSVRTRGK